MSKKGKPRIVRAFTVPQSLGFVSDMLPELSERYDVALLSSPGPEWAGVERDHGGEFRALEVAMERHISIKNDLRSLLRLIKVMRKEKPAMVHSMTPKAGLLCMAAAWLATVPVRVHTFTGLVFPTASGLTRRILMLTDAITCACATHVIPEGEGVKRDLLNHHITRKSLRVLGHGNIRGIDLERFNPEAADVKTAAAPLLRPGTFTFIAIGRLVGDKGINELVEAFCRLHKELPHVRLVLLGSYEHELDPLKPDTLAEIERNPAIKAPGNQPDVRPWLAAANCHVLASYREGFPNVVIEAGAMGLPQIVTDINGANEIIADGVNGVIVAPRSADALYEAMKHMALNEPERLHMAAEARPMIASRFDCHYVRRCLLDFYSEILPA